MTPHILAQQALLRAFIALVGLMEQFNWPAPTNGRHGIPLFVSFRGLSEACQLLLSDPDYWQRVPQQWDGDVAKLATTNTRGLRDWVAAEGAMAGLMRFVMQQRRGEWERPGARAIPVNEWDKTYGKS